MKNSKLLRIISLGLVLVMLAVSLVACKPANGPAEGSPEDSTPVESPSESEQPDESLPEAPGIPEADADLKLADGGNTSFKLVRAEMASAYEKTM